MKENNIINDWLNKNGNPKITKQVEKEASELCKKETLEEASEKYIVGIGKIEFASEKEMQEYAKTDFINGAKWQEQEQDEFAIDFLKFCNKNYQYAKGYYYMKGDFERSMKLNQQQLLQIFKKEKGL